MNHGKFALTVMLAGALVLGTGTAPGFAQATVTAPDHAAAEPSATAAPAPGAEQSAPAAGPAHVTAPPGTQEPAPEAPGATATQPSPAQPSPTEEAPEQQPAEDDDIVAGAGTEDLDFDPVGAGHIVPGPNAPLITEADGSVHTPDGGHEEEHGIGPGAAAKGLGSGTVGSFSASAVRSGTIQVTLVMASLKGTGWGNTAARQRAERAAHQSLETADAYWKSMSQGRLGLSTVRVRYVDASARATDDYPDIMNSISRQVGWTDSPYQAMVVYTPAGDLRFGGYSGYLGAGWTSNGTGGRILMPTPSEFSNNVVTHEFGHILGLLHANSLQCTNGRSDVGFNGARWSDGACSSREYADTLDLMGYAQYNLPTINSYFWEAGRFGRGDEVRNVGTVTEARTVQLAPWGGTAANRAAKFTDPISGEEYYLELRQPAGYDAYLASGAAGNRGVKITKADVANSWSMFSLGIQPSTRPYAGLYGNSQAWQAGQVFTTHTGTTVKINSNTASGASVTITPKNVTASLFYRTSPVQSTKYGNTTDQFLTCDWNGDGVDTAAAFRNGEWHFRNSLTGNVTAARAYFGDAGDQPICGDWDGDGVDTMGVYRNGRVFLRNSNTSGAVDGSFIFGGPGDTAIVGDWDGDGFDTLGVARDAGVGKRFYLTNSNIRPATHGTFAFGNAGDVPVSGDWNNDGFSTVGVKRGLVWHQTNSNIVPRTSRSFSFGNPADRPLTGSWRRGAATEVGVVR